MRVIVRVTPGIVAAAGCFALSRVTTGYVEAASFLLAVFAVAVVVGIAMVSVVDACEDYAIRHPRVRRFTGRCHECGHRMVELGSIFICPTCDRAPVERHLIGRHR